MQNNEFPIYGLGCPSRKIINTTYLSPNEKKCGCQMSKPTKQSPIDYGNPIKTLPNVGSQIINTVTGTPFDSQTVHIQNINNGAATVTQENGQFVIPAQPDDMLLITHVGFGEIKIKASDLTDKIEMDESFDALDEVVIESKKQTGLIILGLAAAFAIIYASADDEKKDS